MSMVTVAAVVGAGTAAYGAYSANRANREQTALQRQALARAGGITMPTQFVRGPNGQNITGFGGGVLQIYDNPMSRLQAQLQGYAGQRAGNLTQNGVPAHIQQAMADVTRRMGGPNLQMGGSFADLERMLGTQTDRAYNDMLGQMGSSRSLMNTAFRGAGRHLEDAAMGGDMARDRQLELLRAQAQPFETRAFNQLQNNLFATGRMGSTGGAMQMEAFARGLGQSDLDRQIRAGEEGRLFSQNALSMASGLSGVRGMEDALINNAFGRFADTANLGLDLNRERFSRSMYSNELGYNRARDILGLRTQMEMLPGQLEAQRLGNVQAALQGQAGLQSQLLELFGAGLSGNQAEANARIGQASNMASIVNSPNFGQGQMANAAMWSQIGQSLMGDQNLSQTLQGIFRPRSQVDYFDMSTLPQRR